MSEPTQASTPETRTSYAWCSWHQGISGTARLVHTVERMSGPTIGLFACADCRTVYRLTPLAD